MQRLICLYATAVIMECKISDFSLKFLFVHSGVLPTDDAHFLAHATRSTVRVAHRRYSFSFAFQKIHSYRMCSFLSSSGDFRLSTKIRRNRSLKCLSKQNSAYYFMLCLCYCISSFVYIANNKNNLILHILTIGLITEFLDGLGF